MELRFEPVPEQVVRLCEDVCLVKFPNLDGARIMYIFDTKRKVSGGRLTFARIKKLNDELKFLAMNDDGITYDYIVFIDKKIWDALEDPDRRRIIYHEFCHCEVDFEKLNPYGIRDHEIQGFYDEADYNADDPRWSERLSLIAESVYDPENEDSENLEEIKPEE